MIFWACGTLTLVSAVLATFTGDIRGAIFSLWLCGLGVSGLYLSMGAEVLAVIQAIVTTLGAICSVFFAITFGEYGATDPRPLSTRAAKSLLPSLMGCSFAFVIWLGVRDIPGLAEYLPNPARSQGQDIASLGKALVGDHLVSLEVLALTLLLVIVGAGVVARPEKEEAS